MPIPAIEDGFEFLEYVYEVGGHDGDDFFRRNGQEYGLAHDGGAKASRCRDLPAPDLF